MEDERKKNDVDSGRASAGCARGRQGPAMQVILSPALTMARGAVAQQALSTPVFAERAAFLADTIAQYSPWQLESLMQISPALALRVCGDYAAFADGSNPAPALFAYTGNAYQNLQPGDFTPEDIAFADAHLRILSALYGVLRPMDAILLHRLELACRLRVEGQTLYAWWGDLLYREVFRAGAPVINLCSGEYTKAIKPYLSPRDRLVGCRFLELRRGRLCCLAMGSKMARGQMARFIIKNRLQTPEELQAFAWEDYSYSPAHSTPDTLVFIR